MEQCQVTIAEAMVVKYFKLEDKSTMFQKVDAYIGAMGAAKVDTKNLQPALWAEAERIVHVQKDGAVAAVSAAG